MNHLDGGADGHGNKKQQQGIEVAFFQNVAIGKDKYKGIDDKAITKCSMQQKIGAAVINVLTVNWKEPAIVEAEGWNGCVNKP